MSSTTTLPAFGSPEAIREDVARHLDRLGEGGGYVCASSHNITESIPLENFLALRDAIHAHRRRIAPV
jgi:uroporphyrinogen decarboxylase